MCEPFVVSSEGKFTDEQTHAARAKAIHFYNTDIKPTIESVVQDVRAAQHAKDAPLAGPEATEVANDPPKPNP